MGPLEPRNPSRGRSILLSLRAQEHLWRGAGVILFALAGVMLMRHQMVGFSFSAMLADLRLIPAGDLILALALTAVSFWAISYYDVVALRQMGRETDEGDALRAGFVANAISQTTGFGLLVGAALRWRMYQGRGLGQLDAGWITLRVSVGFFTGLLAILSLAAVVEPVTLGRALNLDVSIVRGGAIAGIVMITMLLIASAHPLGGGPWARRLPVPNFRVLTRQIGLATLDILPAAVAFWLLIPGADQVSFLALLPIFLAGLGVGLLLGVPIGFGGLEVLCLAGIGTIPAEHLIAAVIAYRVIYYIIPFIAGVALLIGHEWLGAGRTSPPAARIADRVIRVDQPGQLAPELAAIMANSHQAEAGLIYLGDKSALISRDGRAFLMFAETRNSLIALADPVGPASARPRLISDFQELAKRRMRGATFYKSSPAMAAELARAGFTCSNIASEAVIDLAEFDLSARPLRELRRKLRKAAAAKVEIHLHSAGQVPSARLQPLSDAWVARKGAEQGFSLGQFSAPYLQGCACLEAQCDGETIAFLSLWKSGDGREWSIDLMRQAETLPDGTMHLLIASAAEAAKAAGAARLSLCAVPMAGLEEGKTLLEKLSKHAAALPQTRVNHGLRRFKQSFNPGWEPRYLATETRGLPLLALFDIYRLINPCRQKPG